MIFISYSSENKTLAGALKVELNDAHYSCFLAHDDIIVGSDWHKKIWTELRGCDVFVGLVTPEFTESAFCQQELGAAVALKKRRLLILSGVKKLPGFVSRYQGVKRDKLIETLDTSDKFRELRTESWIAALKSVKTWEESNPLHKRFSSSWAHMSEAQKLRWLAVASYNTRVSGDIQEKPNPLLYKPTKATLEPRESAPFFRDAFDELKPLLTEQWLFDNDKKDKLHDFQENSFHKAEKKAAK